MVIWTQKPRAWDLGKGAGTEEAECLKLSGSVDHKDHPYAHGDRLS